LDARSDTDHLRAELAKRDTLLNQLRAELAKRDTLLEQLGAATR